MGKCFEAECFAKEDRLTYEFAYGFDCFVFFFLFFLRKLCW